MTDAKKKPVKSAPQMAPDGSISFEFTIPAEEVVHGYQEVIREYASSIELKGFRKGKAPLDLVEKSLDKAQVYSHVLEHILPGAYQKALIANKFIPVLEPRVTPIAMEEGKDWTFKAETSGRPEVKLGDYKKYISAALKKSSSAKPKKDDKDAKNEPGDDKLTVALDALLKNAQIAIAPILIDEETKSALAKLESQLKSLSLTVEDYAKSIKKSGEELAAEYRTTAETNLKLEFILNELISDINPEVKETDPYKKYSAQRKAALDFISAL